MDDSETGLQPTASEAERLAALLERPEATADEDDPRYRSAGTANARALQSPPPEAGEETGPAERPVTGDEELGEGDPAERPAIAAPRSWPADMRDAFAKLPGDLQAVIANRENERDAAFNRQVREAAERKQAAEAELAAASTERRQYLANLSSLIDGIARGNGLSERAMAVAALEKLNGNLEPWRLYSPGAPKSVWEWHSRMAA